MILIISYLFISVLYGGGVLAKSAKSTFQVTKFENDCLDQNLPIIFTNISVKMENSMIWIRFDTVISEDVAVNEDLKVEYSLTRCLDKSSPDSCEEYHKITIPYFCKIMKIPGPWSEYMENLSTPMSCPLRKGNYSSKKQMAVDLEQVEKLKLSGHYYYIVKIKEYEMKSKKLIMCLKTEGST